MGDLNYDISNPYDQVKVSEIETLFQLNQYIRQTTRVTNHSSTTIDHIYISEHFKPTLSSDLPVNLKIYSHKTKIFKVFFILMFTNY